MDQLKGLASKVGGNKDQKPAAGGAGGEQKDYVDKDPLGSINYQILLKVIPFPTPSSSPSPLPHPFLPPPLHLSTSIPPTHNPNNPTNPRPLTTQVSKRARNASASPPTAAPTSKSPIKAARCSRSRPGEFDSLFPFVLFCGECGRGGRVVCAVKGKR
ncbi:MAG: hypothetical protein L6R40_006695 [Gallowayella cf. fulva]|nr:MAG: hypothetical protein L6R40_006695 [Xanthomendoza cf. fulva]